MVDSGSREVAAVDELRERIAVLETRAQTQSENGSKRLREWVGFGLATIATLVSLYTFWTARQVQEADARAELVAELDAVWDLLGGEPGTTDIREVVPSGAQRELARRRLQAILEVYPSNPRALLIEGVLHLSEGRTADAQRSVEAAIEIDPDYLAARNNLATVHKAAGRLDEADRLLSAILEDDSEHTLALSNLAAVRVEQGRLEEALELMDAAVRATPNDGVAHLNKGRVLAKLRMHDAAITSLRVASDTWPWPVEAPQLLVVELLGAAQQEEAARVLRTLTRRHPDLPERVIADLERQAEASGNRAIYKTVAWVYGQLGDAPRAQAAAALAIQR